MNKEITQQLVINRLGLQTGANTRDQSSSQSNSSQDQISLLKMQITQLKRQNIFLKQKIEENNSSEHRSVLRRRGSLLNSSIYASVNQKGYDNTQLRHKKTSLKFLIEQINGVLKSILNLYKIQFQNNSNLLLSKTAEKALQNIPSIQKIVLQKKLEQLTLIQQSQRYPKLLQLFIDFYSSKNKQQIQTKQVLEQYINQMIGLNKKILQKYHKKKVNGVNSQNSSKNSQILFRVDADVPDTSIVSHNNKWKVLDLL